MNQPLVSIIVPTYFSAVWLEKCFSSIKKQTYTNIELIVVDNNSTDNVKEIATKYQGRFFTAGPDQSKGRVFGAPFQRNYGFKQSNGEYVYYVDADMELPEGLIEECMSIVTNDKKYKALIIAEESFGIGFWAKCKWLERRTYWGDDLVEAPRFFEKKTLEMMGYLDDTVGADDWDLALRMREEGYDIGRTKRYVMHNEGALTLGKLIKKRFLYGKDAYKFGKKHGGGKFLQYFNPLRASYVRNAGFLLKHPVLLIGMIFMRVCEYMGGGVGMLYGKFVIKHV
jgi:glycosyltransferase involved in cell wall biosynthesis